MAKVDSKACSRCKQILPATSFTADNRAAGGLQPQCKPCRAARVKEQRHADPETHRAKARDWKSRNPEKVLAYRLSNRERNAEKINARQRAYYRRNSAKAIEWVRQNRLQNPERTRELARGYQARRRLLKKGGVGGAEMRDWMLAQRKVCHWCAKRCSRNYHIDHITPLAKGGEHTLPNLCIACPSCNLRKSARDPIEWAQMIGKLL